MYLYCWCCEGGEKREKESKQRIIRLIRPYIPCTIIKLVTNRYWKNIKKNEAKFDRTEFNDMHHSSYIILELNISWLILKNKKPFKIHIQSYRWFREWNSFLWIFNFQECLGRNHFFEKIFKDGLSAIFSCSLSIWRIFGP